VSRKIRDAEKEWVPIIIVVGEKEKAAKKFTPRFRSDSIGKSNKSYSIKDLFKLIEENAKGFPQESIPLSVHLSKRPKFKG
jgi:threonyl-tRNA synthetase